MVVRRIMQQRGGSPSLYPMHSKEALEMISKQLQTNYYANEECLLFGTQQ